MSRWKRYAWEMVVVGGLVLAGWVWAQSTHHETVVWDFVNGLKSRGVDVTGCTDVGFADPGDPLPFKIICL